MNPTAVELPLRDIHAAAAPPWWPPAPGWWLVALVAAALAGWLGLRLWRYGRRLRRRRALRGEVLGIVARWQARRDDQEFLAALSAFFRRLLVHVGGRRDLAGVSGRAWAELLAGPAVDQAERELAAALAEAPYRRAGPPIGEAERFVPLAERWIRRVTEPPRA